MRSKLAAVVLGALVVAVSVASCRGGCCKGPDEDPPPMPSATAPPAVSSVVLEVEDAGEDASDADDGDARKGGPGVSTLVACCRALAQNSNSQANPLVKGSMIQAASVCEAAARNNDAAGVNAALRQFGMKCN